MKKQWYYKTWFIILCLVFFAPLGLILMYLKNSWSKKTQIIVAIVSMLWFLSVITSDTEEPVITLNKKEYSVERGKTITEEKLKTALITEVTDNKDDMSKEDVIITDFDNIDFDKKGNYAVTLNATDSSENTATSTVTVNVVSNEEDKKKEAEAKAKAEAEAKAKAEAEAKAKEEADAKAKAEAEAEKYGIEGQNAIIKAQRYAERMNMSEAGIYDQLTSEYGEGFEPEVAQYAIENIDVDYNENALEKAKSYQSMMSMSKSNIYDQLISSYGEQFTPEQAQYAIDNLPN